MTQRYVVCIFRDERREVTRRGWFSLQVPRTYVHVDRLAREASLQHFSILE